MNYFNIFVFGCALFVAGCFSDEKTKSRYNDKLDTLHAVTKPTDSGTIDQRVNPLSCLGGIGLDYMAIYAVAGPNHYSAMQSKQKTYLATDYFSGDFQKNYNKMKNRLPDIAPATVAAQEIADNILGNLLPVAYSAMCVEDVETLQLARSNIIKARQILSTRPQNTHAERRVLQFTEYLLWELNYAEAVIAGNFDILLDLKEKFRAYDVLHRAKSGLYFYQPADKESFASQKRNGNFVPRIEIARYHLLRASVNIRLAHHYNDDKSLIKAVRTFQNLAKQFDPNSFAIEGRSKALTVGKVFDASIYESGYFTRANVYQKWLEAMLIVMDNEELRKKYRASLSAPDASGVDLISTREKQIKLEPDMLGMHYDNLFDRSRGWLLYEDSPFLWALRHNIHAQLHINLMTAPPSSTMTGERVPASEPNFKDHCHAYFSLRSAQQVLPTIQLPKEMKDWCNTVPKPVDPQIGTVTIIRKKPKQ